jgi:acyl transferase domain-containing protein
MVRKENTGDDYVSLKTHPLVHQNTSDITEQRFSSLFTGSEFFLADNIIKGQKVLPGIACLEMAHEAVIRAAGIYLEDKAAVRLKDVTWFKPISITQSEQKVHTAVLREDNGEFLFEIYGKSEKDNGEDIIYCQGSVAFGTVSHRQKMDIEALRGSCSQKVIPSRQCYEMFKEAGVDYGPGFKVIEQLFAGQEQVLAKLSIPDEVLSTLNRFQLHPAIMDGVLQASIGFQEGYSCFRPFMPRTLKSVDIYDNCTQEMWALVARSKDVNAVDKAFALDIDIYDKQGNVCISMKGVILECLESETIAS